MSPRVDLLVLGGGFWGCAMAQYARRKGVSVLQVTAPRHERPSASRAASGYYSPRWYADRGAIERAAETAQALGVDIEPLRASRTDASSLRTGEALLSELPDTHLFDRHQMLACGEDAIEATVSALDARSEHPRAFGAGEPIEARRIYVAAGMWTDDLLRASGLPSLGVSGLLGAAAIVDQPWQGPPLWIRTTPYSSVAIRRVEHSDGLAYTRVCATVEARPLNAKAYRDRMMEVARLGIAHTQEHADPKAWEPASWEVGARPVYADKGPLVRQVAPHVLVGTGGGRVGGILAYQAAEEAFQLMFDPRKQLA